MKSKYQEVGLCVLLYKLLANSSEMVEVGVNIDLQHIYIYSLGIQET